MAAQAASVPASGVRPRVTLRCEPVSDGPERWCADALADLKDRTIDLDLEDEDAYDLDGHDVAYRRYAHRAGTADLLCDEWAWLVDGLGFVLTCTVAREDYVDYCDVFEAIAETFEPDPAGASSSR